MGVRGLLYAVRTRTRTLWLDAGYAYESPAGNVYYSVSSFPGYGQLSGNSLDDLRAGRYRQFDSFADLDSYVGEIADRAIAKHRAGQKRK